MSPAGIGLALLVHGGGSFRYWYAVRVWWPGTGQVLFCLGGGEKTPASPTPGLGVFSKPPAGPTPGLVHYGQMLPHWCAEGEKYLKDF